MALFVWKDLYRVKVKEMDRRLKLMVEILNEFHEAVMKRSSR